MIFSSSVVNLRLLNGGRNWLSSSSVISSRLSNPSLVASVAQARITHPWASRVQQLSQLRCIYPAHPTGSTSSHFHYYSTGRPGENQGKKARAGKKMWVTSLLVGVGLGGLVGLGYTWREKQKKVMPIANIDTGNDLLFSEPPPIDVIAKEFHNTADDSGLKLTLFQYQPCPFCKKARAFLDYSGLSYKVVEVNPVTKAQLRWSAYKKVPTLMVELKEGHQQINDSTVIISTLQSYLSGSDKNMLHIVKYYPVVEYNDDAGVKHSEIMNRYFIMLGDQMPEGQTKEIQAEERRWRQWSDDVLMHTLSPNIYRTWDEAVEAFNMFSRDGDWERLFTWWERQVVIYFGAAVMYMIGKRLKKRHNLAEDVRQSLYQEVTHFLQSVQTKGGTFMGGDAPNLADLAVYGCLNSIEGTRAFADLTRHTRVTAWYEAVRCQIDERRAPLVASVGASAAQVS